tara:strand:+ start:425 stop:856 length:432 start_codon:yes stop_codon:yes gene_type:complete
MYKTYIDMITQWAATKGYKVVGKWEEDAFYDKDKEIVYSLRTQNPKNQVYSLLHECGHALAFESKGYKNRFPTLSKRRFKTAKVNSRTNTFRVESILEEYDAWARGLKLAERLGIEIDKEDYGNYASRNVMTYVRLPTRNVGA